VDFLKLLFNEELDGDGGITIAGAVFQRSRILSELEPATYELAFSEWRAQRKERMLEVAEAILALYDNRERFERLKHAYQTGSVIPFVGAGLSIPSGYLGWTAFLYKLRDESYVPKDELDEMVRLGEYEEAAQRIFDDSNRLFNEGLVNHFAGDRDIYGPVQYLPYIFAGSVFTTNFDSAAISGDLLSAVVSTCYILGFRKDNPNVFNMLVQNLPHSSGIKCICY
jgi:hypothetical protein